MADTITLKSSSYDGRYMKLVCEQTSNGGAKNTSTIKWTLSTVGGNESYYSTGATKVVINGTTVYSKSRVDWSSKSFPASIGSKSGEIEVSHTDDGTKTIKVSFSTAIYTSTVSEYEEKWELDTIARYGTSTQSLNSKTETKIKMNWASDNTVDYLWYSTDNGSNWTGVDVTNGKSGTYTISGLKANTTYKIKTRIRRKDSQLTTDSSVLSVTTYNYPDCTSSPNFVLGDNVTLKFYNPLNRAFNFYIIANGTQIGVEYDCDSTSYTGLSSPTSSVPKLYATIPNNTSGKYKVKVVYGSSTITRDNGNTYSVNESECLPQFFNTSYTYKDTNSTVVNVTGDDQILVKGQSILSVEIDTPMVALNSAKGKNYIASIDTLSKTITYSSSGAVSGVLGTITSAGTKKLNVRAYDSRDISTLAYKNITVYDYAKPVINATVTRLNNFEEQTTLTVSGSYSKLTIDSTDKNTIKSVEYRYCETGGTMPTDWTPLTATITNGKFTCNDVIFSLDNDKSFSFQVRAIDNLSNNTVSATVDVGQAIFFISTNKKACYINGIELPTFDSMYPVGSVYCSSTNTNPATQFGGTWSLIDKGFKTAYIEITQSATDYLSGFEVISIRTDQTVRFRMKLTTNVEINDTSVTLGTVDLTKHGLTLDGDNYFLYSILGGVAISDGGQATIYYDLNSNGTLDTNDVLTVSGTHVLPAGSSFYINAVVTVRANQMIDSFCDKFYWKRTA